MAKPVMSRRTFAAASISLMALAGVARAANLTSDDVTIGAADAPLHLVEYASTTCPHCARFHAAAWSTLRSEYIDRRRVRFTFREIATPPAPVALAMFQLARCETAAPAEYLRRLGVLFERQRAILDTGTGAGVRDALLALGPNGGSRRNRSWPASTTPLERNGSPAQCSKPGLWASTPRPRSFSTARALRITTSKRWTV